MRRFLAITGLVFVSGLTLFSVFAWGSFLGYQKRPAVEAITGVINREIPEDIAADLEPFWAVWRLIDERYATSSPGSDERIWGAIDGLVETLDDPYSVFLPPAERELFEGDIRGNFGGVGMEVGMRDGALVVIAPLPDTPAKRAGVRSGDRIIKIDDRLTEGLSVTEAVELIRGEVGTSVILSLERVKAKNPVIVKITRQTIKVPTLETELIDEDKKVFLIRLFNFSADSPRAFREALREFIKTKTDKLIIDLRGNPGGYLESAVEIASWFLPLGEPIVYEDHANDDDNKTYRSRGYNVFTKELKLVILVDGGSASASEILAGALSEYGRAKLVGEKTFGKGSVQELIPLPGDGALKLTVARWLTPKGHDISSEGLMPELVVKSSEDAEDEERGEGREDAQLRAAIDLLSR